MRSVRSSRVALAVFWTIQSVGILAVGATPLSGTAQTPPKPAPPSIEESMVNQTNSVLNIMRVWHNQISEDQATIAALRSEVTRLTSELSAKTAAEPTK